MPGALSTIFEPAARGRRHRRCAALYAHFLDSGRLGSLRLSAG